MPVRGLPLAYVAVGGVLVWSGVENEPVTSIFRTLATGKAPAKGPAETFATPAGSTTTTESGSGTTPAAGDTGAHGASAAANQALARLSVVASHPSWAAGTEWDDWVSLWNQESGWNNLALNASSGAFGIAQSLGHGTAGTAGKYGNAYGAEYGLSTASAISANNGSALPQIQWGIGYIAATYGSPGGAWAHEESAGWY